VINGGQDVLSVDFGSSAEGQPITGFILGSGEETVMLLGGMSGKAPGGETLLHALIDLLPAYPNILNEKTVVLIPACNPDGLEVESRLNARRVDISRNFPSQNWEGKDGGPGGSSTGASPGSEPATLAVGEAMKKYPPDLVLSIQAAAGCVDYLGPGAGEIAYKLSKASTLPMERHGSPPGSLGAYLTMDYRIPFIALDLEYHHRRGIMPPYERERYLRAILEVLK
jgi:protein MpaA